MRFAQSLCASLVALMSLVTAGSASAQATRTWVSGVGDDVNPCSRTAPCKTWAGAISKTAAGGEIDALDPGGFGGVTINKAITLDGRGTMASILVNNSFGIKVIAGANDVVVLRGLSITGGNPNAANLGTVGVLYQTGLAVHVEDCTISNFATSAIDFEPAAAATLFVKNVTINSTAGGLISGGLAQAVIAKSHLYNNTVGVDAKGSARVSIQDSVIAGNATAGIRTAATAQVNMHKGAIAANGTGVLSAGLARIAEVMFSYNTVGVSGNVTTFGNNQLAAGNGSDGAFSALAAQQ